MGSQAKRKKQKPSQALLLLFLFGLAGFILAYGGVRTSLGASETCETCPKASHPNTSKCCSTAYALSRG